MLGSKNNFWTIWMQSGPVWNVNYEAKIFVSTFFCLRGINSLQIYLLRIYQHSLKRKEVDLQAITKGRWPKYFNKHRQQHPIQNIVKHWNLTGTCTLENIDQDKVRVRLRDFSEHFNRHRLKSSVHHATFYEACSCLVYRLFMDLIFEN